MPKRVLFFILGLLFAAPGGAWAGETASRQAALSCGVAAENFDLVKPGFYRGGKPSLTDLERLREIGVKTIIDFTMANRVSEKKRARELGMRYVNIPWDTDRWLSWFYDYDRVAAKFLGILRDSSNSPVYVHCFHGRDRTGTMVALYRIKEDGWTFEEAFAEMRRYGFSRKKYPNLVSYLKRAAGQAGDEKTVFQRTAAVREPAGFPPAMGGTPLHQYSVEEEAR